MKTKLASRVAATTLVSVLAGIGLTLPAAGAAAPAAGPVRSEMYDTAHGRELQASVDEIMKTGTVGVVARSTGPRGSRSATGGVADQATGNAARPDDRFRIASTSKTFVATVVLQLVGEGSLSLDDTVEHWLPGVVSGNGNDGSAITLRQLLQHTSGLFDYKADFPELTSLAGYQADRYTTWTSKQLVTIGMRHPPGFKPGAGWSYSNTNYILAGMIIEEVTGHGWAQEVTARIIRRPRPGTRHPHPSPRRQSHQEPEHTVRAERLVTSLAGRCRPCGGPEALFEDHPLVDRTKFTVATALAPVPLLSFLTGGCTQGTELFVESSSVDRSLRVVAAQTGG